jgi:glycerol-3-phosphate dehydrogenase
MENEEKIFDLLIIGGGINGAGIARDAAGRGFSVALFEQHDLGEHTSSASTKLLHGEPGHLEAREFGMVRDALIERERLLRIAPHIVWPLEFRLPHDRARRSAWRIRLGLFLYDHLARREFLPGSGSLRLPDDSPLQKSFKRAFSYADCWVEDSRLVVLNAMDAAQRGAKIYPRTKVLAARAEGKIWQVQTEAGIVPARAIVNAAGPWAGRVLHDMLGRKAAHAARLAKGSHIITSRLYPENHAYILQNPDRRMIAVIPYEQNYTLIGSTDMPFDGDPSRVHIAEAEIDYLCASVNRYFRTRITPDDAIWTYSGVRPVFETGKNPAAADLELTKDAVTPPILSVFGGKLTTYRRLAEQALEKLLPAVGGDAGKSWTAGAYLPGGDIADFPAFKKMLRVRNGHLDVATLHRLAYSYGTLTDKFVGYDMGEDFGGGLHRSEIDYLVKHEWARTAEDVLWRRSKLGLHVGEDTFSRVRDYLAAKVRI